jgi:Ethanolamine utilization protein EutJ (predicted chaperonin)
MTQAYNLSQLANNVNSSGQLDASTALYNAVPAAATLATTNFTIIEVGGKLLIKYGATTIASITSTGVITSGDNITAYGTP